MESGVWYVVDSINNLEELTIQYPVSADKQEEIAYEFQLISKANINICAGAFDGIWIWIAKLMAKQAKKAKVNQAKFLCGQKGKFGLNC